MLPARGLIVWPLAATLMDVGALVFNSNLNAFGQGLGGTFALAGADHFRTKIEQHLAIPTLAIGNQRQVPGSVDHVDQRPYRPLEKLAILTSTVEFPDKARRPLQQYDSPPLSVLRGNVFFYGSKKG